MTLFQGFSIQTLAWICFMYTPRDAMMLHLLCIYGSCSDFVVALLIIGCRSSGAD